MPDMEKVITDAEVAIKILYMIDEPTPWCDFVRVSFERVLELLNEDEKCECWEKREESKKNE